MTTGWRCLEIGAGGGSIAAWLAERVGTTGHVIATDIDLSRFTVQLSNVESIRHDIVVDPLPDPAFDLIHARLVLVHLPDRDAVLRKLVGALRPGGWLAIEDFDLRLIPTLTDGNSDDERLINKVAGLVSGDHLQTSVMVVRVWTARVAPVVVAWPVPAHAAGATHTGDGRRCAVCRGAHCRHGRYHAGRGTPGADHRQHRFLRGRL